MSCCAGRRDVYPRLRCEQFGNRPLLYAAQGGHALAAWTLTAQGHADVDAVSRSGSTALFEAVRAEADDTIMVLLRAAPDVNFVNARGTHVLVRTGRPHLVKLLLNWGANPATRTPSGRTVLEALMPELAGEVKVGLQLRAAFPVHGPMAKPEAATADPAAEPVPEWIRVVDSWVAEDGVAAK